MKSERGFVHLLIAGEIVLLILVVIFGIARQVKGPKESPDYAISTQDNVIEEMPTETEITETETEIPLQVETFSEGVESALANMTIEQKIAQLLIVSPEALTGTDRATVAGNGTRTALGNYPVGGLIYARSNYLGRTQMRELIGGAQEMSFEQSGNYLFAVTRVQVNEEPMLAVAWNGAEEEMAELVRVDGDITRASLGGLSLMTYIETEEVLAEKRGGDTLCCVAIEANQLDPVTMLQNGADMLCITTDFETVYNAIVTAVSNGEISEVRIHEAAGHVLTEKEALSATENEE